LLKRIKNRNGSLGRYYKDNEEGVVIALECRGCDSLKDVDDFHRNKDGFAGRVTRCKVCARTKSVEWGRENNGRKLEYMREYYNLNREEVLAYQRDYYDVNREVIITRSLKWSKDNPDRKKVHRQNRVARERGLENTLTKDQHTEIMRTFNDSCALSGKRGDIHLDHVIPVRVGHKGTSICNLIPLHASLNTSKNDSNIFEWFKSNKARFGLCEDLFDAVITYLAELNDMSVSEYRDYIYECHANPNDITTEAS